jgi:hypothetical protein
LFLGPNLVPLDRQGIGGSIDHLGILQPRVPPTPAQPWADLPKVLELGRRANATIKVSGACTLSREPYPFSDIRDPLARVFMPGFSRRMSRCRPAYTSDLNQ